MEQIQISELDPLAFILDHPEFNVKPSYREIPKNERPYNETDFMLAGIDSMISYKDRRRWIPYYGYCNTLFAPSKLNVIHKAQSTAAFMAMNKFRLLLDEFCSDSDEVIFDNILPFVSRNVVLHEDHLCSTREDFKRTLQQLTNDLILD